MPRGSAAARLRGFTAGAQLEIGGATITDMKNTDYFKQDKGSHDRMLKTGALYGGSKSSTGLYGASGKWVTGPSAVMVKRKLNGAGNEDQGSERIQVKNLLSNVASVPLNCDSEIAIRQGAFQSSKQTAGQSSSAANSRVKFMSTKQQMSETRDGS